MKTSPKALIVCGDGINCERETALGFELAGIPSEILHVNVLLQEGPQKLKQFQILAFPGGFSFGDELGSGRILALKLSYALGDALREFIVQGGLVLGICNGFQVLVQLGLLPGPAPRRLEERIATLAMNAQGSFQDRWVSCEVPKTHCKWTQNLPAKLDLPIRHGEGRLLFKSAEDFAQIQKQNLIALTYVDDVNGSTGRIAGLTDSTGQVLGLMPHPEAAMFMYQHPHFHRQKTLDPSVLALGKTPSHLIFKNAVSALK